MTATLRARFLDVIVRHKLAQQGAEPDEAWLDADGLIDFDRPMGHWTGPVLRMRDNAVPVVDDLLEIIASRTLGTPRST